MHLIVSPDLNLNHDIRLKSFNFACRTSECACDQVQTLGMESRVHNTISLWSVVSLLADLVWSDKSSAVPKWWDSEEEMQIDGSIHCVDQRMKPWHHFAWIQGVLLKCCSVIYSEWVVSHKETWNERAWINCSCLHKTESVLQKEVS